jgi:hypothetical protein
MPLKRGLIVAATVLAALIVVALCFASAHAALAGAIWATRYSARFSALVFALALAARAERPRALAARRAELMIAFVAAHGIHYATVLARAAVEPGNHLRQPSLERFLSLGGGFGLIVLLAATARPHSRGAARAQALACYVALAAFVVALGTHAAQEVGAAVTLACVVAALGWRVAVAVARA